MEHINNKYLEEFKTMTVTLNDPKRMKDLIQAIRIFGPKLGLKTDVMNPKKLKVYGNNTDLNKYAKDIKNFYGGQIKAESYEPLEELKVGDMVRYIGPTRTGLKKGQIGSVVNKTSSGYQVDGMLMRSGVKHKKNHLQKIKEEVEDLEEFTDKQIERLRKEYESLRGKEILILKDLNS